MTHNELIDIGAKWLKKHNQNILIPNCSIIAKDMKAATPTGETPDIIGWGSGRSVMIEVKVSRADFLKDKNKPFRMFNNLGAGQLKYYLTPENLISIDEIPWGWGLLYHTNKIEIIKEATQTQANLLTERAILLSIIRRNKPKTKKNTNPYPPKNSFYEKHPNT